MKCCVTARFFVKTFTPKIGEMGKKSKFKGKFGH